MGDLNTTHQSRDNKKVPQKNVLGDLQLPKADIEKVEITKNEKGSISVALPEKSKSVICFSLKSEESNPSSISKIPVNEKIFLENENIKYRILDNGKLQILASQNVGSLVISNKDETGYTRKIDIFKTLQEQETKHKIPEDIKELAKNKNYEEHLIKKDPSGNYTYCRGDVCISLGKSKLDLEETKPSETKESQSSLVSNEKHTETKKEEPYVTMSSNDARWYLMNNPKENVFVVITAPTWCTPCKEYDKRIGPIAQGLKGIAKLIIVNEESNPGVQADFNIDKYPTTLLFPANRRNALTSEVNFVGPQVLDNLKEKLHKVLNRN